jgi:hypothetical protein
VFDVVRGDASAWGVCGLRAWGRGVVCRLVAVVGVTIFSALEVWS